MFYTTPIFACGCLSGSVSLVWAGMQWGGKLRTELQWPKCVSQSDCQQICPPTATWLTKSLPSSQPSILSHSWKKKPKQTKKTVKWPRAEGEVKDRLPGLSKTREMERGGRVRKNINNVANSNSKRKRRKIVEMKWTGSGKVSISHVKRKRNS